MQSMLYFYSSPRGLEVAFDVAQFADFELDSGRYELRRGDRVLKLEKIPMDLLTLLVESNDQLVSRDQIIEKIWGKDVFLDTEHGINTAIRKIRQALGDDPDQPRFVQTVTGKGYRFIAPVALIGEAHRNGDNSRKVSLATELPPEVPQVGSEVPTLTAAPPPVTNPILSSNALRTAFLAIAALVLLAAALVGFNVRGWRDQHIGRPSSQRIRALAVLPLENLSGDPTQDYFADGMTDELITMLAKNSTLSVTSRTSVMQYKGAHRPLPQIARELGVDAILEGSVSRSGDQVHMTIQLIQAASDTHVWAESYERKADDAVGLPGEAARAIAKKLNRAALQSTPPQFVSPEAHDAYLRGKYIWFAGSNDEAGKYFRKATELQPDYALGWSGLSVYYSAGLIEGNLKPEDSLAQAEAAAMKSVELDDSLPEAHLALAGSMLVHFKWARAEQEVNRAIELDPKFAEAYHLRSKILAAVNRHDEAIESQKKATELDPFARPFAMALSYIEARRYDEALADAHMRLETTPQDIGLHWILYETYRRVGRQKEAVQELQQIVLLSGDKDGAEQFGRSFRQGGYRAVLRHRLSDLQRDSPKQNHSPVEWAGLYAELGQREKSLSLLQEAYRHHSPMLFDIQNDPTFDFLHSDSRYRSIINGMGLPPAY
jgi:TolB-like protein/DNA-binding winged helix-turn-helix (wHTH) protein